jgi:hypothetical protein
VQDLVDLQGHRLALPLGGDLPEPAVYGFFQFSSDGGAANWHLPTIEGWVRTIFTAKREMENETEEGSVMLFFANRIAITRTYLILSKLSNEIRSQRSCTLSTWRSKTRSRTPDVELSLVVKGAGILLVIQNTVVI